MKGLVYDMQIKFLESKPKWFQYTIFGALSYLGLTIIIYLLAFITTPIGLRHFFEQIIKIIIFPAYFLTLEIVYNLIKNPMDYGIPLVLLTLFFISIIGALIGYLIYFIKTGYKNIRN